MTKRIEIIGAQPKKVQVVDQSRPGVDASLLANAIGAEQCGEFVTGKLDPISLVELGTELLRRLRSSGGRPALTDASELCRVPLSTDDIKALEMIVSELSDSTGSKPSLGQLASVIVRTYLATNTGSSSRKTCHQRATTNAWPEPWNGNREVYEAAQQIVQRNRSTWGKAA